MAMSWGKSGNHALNTIPTTRPVLGHRYDSHESACESSVPPVFGRGVRGGHTGPLTMVKTRWQTKVQLRDEVHEASGNFDKRTSPADASRSSASLPRGTPSNVNRTFGQRDAIRCRYSKRRRLISWPTTVTRIGYTTMSSRK